MVCPPLEPQSRLLIAKPAVVDVTDGNGDVSGGGRAQTVSYDISEGLHPGTAQALHHDRACADDAERQPAAASNALDRQRQMAFRIGIIRGDIETDDGAARDRRRIRICNGRLIDRPGTAIRQGAPGIRFVDGTVAGRIEAGRTHLTIVHRSR